MGAKIGCENLRLPKWSPCCDVTWLSNLITIPNWKYSQCLTLVFWRGCEYHHFERFSWTILLLHHWGVTGFFFYEKLLWYMLSYFKFIILVIRISVSIKHLSYTFRHRKHMNDNVKQQDTFFFKWKITLSAA